ncbi:MAG TPA: hypothetical protein DDW94_09800 [Deltaproteobacteria bacterium]|nr:MAG: hypothetical protein A2Z79_12400 [Deltaproteobacteria bacterium GWA2_55_82]OGQ63971.1 MAG: hypothetical protein A3I81_07930 [Deltaproteobacteria bacterium RIFCSPLOWO2_02_FULL_55_12]OIJ73404.1 MAG: hypothetical protein A2V21_303470 [Deltaproteobacteria bacterium GWC2_55_46]HBG47264.1 hypothetical protein [Deltaproteobacteria bacterium]HCY10030.1 hypothetical protein [Deltaproteobacteria bacterium]
MRYIKLISALAALFLSAAGAYASPSVIELRGEVWDDARGEAVIDDIAGGQKQIKIAATGLEPNSVFSIWLIDVTPMLGEVGVGSGDLTFVSDGDGRGSYIARVPGAQFKDWDKIEVLHHPNKDTEDVEGAELALRGNIGNLVNP